MHKREREREGATEPVAGEARGADGRGLCGCVSFKLSLSGQGSLIFSCLQRERRLNEPIARSGPIC